MSAGRMGLPPPRILLLAAALLCAPPPLGALNADAPGDAPPSGFVFKGLSYPSFQNGSYISPESAASLDALAKVHANWLAVVPTQFASSIRNADFHATDQTESNANVAQAIAAAHARGMAAMLKPHIDSLDEKWRGDFAPEDFSAWFRNYKAMVLDYARLAAASGADMFSIGCEFDSLTGPAYRAQWLDIIAAVREVYDGPITYAGDWIAAKDVSFWDKVDYIGIDAYNPLSDHPDPSVDELIAGWTQVPRDRWAAANADNLSPVEFYHRLSITYDRPVIFTEIGYKSIAGATTMPGDWQRQGVIALQEQANAYEAFFAVWTRQSSWMKGAFFWNWEPHPHPETEAHIGWGDYTPQNKPAEASLSGGFATLGAAAPANAR
jgi:hypothetical protein